MSVRAILLRVLLSVSLVLNGATGAAAAVRMQMPHDNAQAVAALAGESVESSPEEMPCHQQAGEKAPMAAADDEPSKSNHSTADCCKSSSCNCACVQAAQAPLGSMFIQTLLVDQSHSVSPLSPGHPSPALSSLIRPPIG